MPVCAEGQVEHQKLNQTTALVLFGWVFGVQLDSLEKKLVTFAELNFNQNSVIIICTIRVFTFDKTDILLRIN